jgi:hypothetical protein
MITTTASPFYQAVLYHSTTIRVTLGLSRQYLTEQLLAHVNYPARRYKWA